MSTQEELETLRASESIKHANLQELARLVLNYNDPEHVDDAYTAMVNFAKGVAQ